MSSEYQPVEPFDEYLLVVNDEEQHSIWPAGLECPAGWRDAGFRGTKQQCLDKVRMIWTDMRPRSLRAWMDGAAEPFSDETDRASREA